MAQRLAEDLDHETGTMTFPAIRGIQAGKEFYVAMCSLKSVAKHFSFNDSQIQPEIRAQRILRESRIPVITNYIVNNPKDYIFSSLTVSVDTIVNFFPAPLISTLKIQTNRGLLKL